jgi:hypothetical protein
MTNSSGIKSTHSSQSFTSFSLDCSAFFLLSTSVQNLLILHKAILTTIKKSATHKLTSLTESSWRVGSQHRLSIQKWTANWRQNLRYTTSHKYSCALCYLFTKWWLCLLPGKAVWSLLMRGSGRIWVSSSILGICASKRMHTEMKISKKMARRLVMWAGQALATWETKRRRRIGRAM